MLPNLLLFEMEIFLIAVAAAFVRSWSLVLYCLLIRLLFEAVNDYGWHSFNDGWSSLYRRT